MFQVFSYIYKLWTKVIISYIQNILLLYFWGLNLFNIFDAFTINSSLLFSLSSLDCDRTPVYTKLVEIKFIVPLSALIFIVPFGAVNSISGVTAV